MSFLFVHKNSVDAPLILDTQAYILYNEGLSTVYVQCDIGANLCNDVKIQTYTEKK